MTDILLVVWKIFLGIVLALAAIFLIVTCFLKLVEFIKGEEGDDYRR